MKRAAVAESPGDPDCLILEIRSRRPYYDSVDQVPISLSAFVGWRVCYEYIRTDDELWEPAPPELEVNYPALASAWLIGSRFSCVNLGGCEVEIREESSHRREVVCSAQRAERFGRSLPLAWNFQSLQVDLEGCVSPTKLGEIIATLRNECCDLAGRWPGKPLRNVERVKMPEVPADRLNADPRCRRLRWPRCRRFRDGLEPKLAEIRYRPVLGRSNQYERTE